MINYDELLKELEQQEKELQFSVFNNETALNIGLLLVERSKQEKRGVTIDINRNGHQLFHYSCEGTTPDNDQWIIRKCRVVNRFHQSSYRFAMNLAKSGSTMEEKHYISSIEYAAAGGAFPIIIKNVGVVGTIAVSGLPQADDHAWVVAALRAFI